MQKEIMDIKIKLKPFVAPHAIKKMAVFGSVARGEAKKNSDVDVLIEFSKPKSLLGFVILKRQMGEALGRKIDLVTYKSLSPYLRKSILANQVIIYEKRA